MRNKFKSLGFIELETRKDGTKFTSKGLRDHANALNAHTSDYSDTQKSILGEACSHCSCSCGVMRARSLSCVALLASRVKLFSQNSVCCWTSSRSSMYGRSFLAWRCTGDTLEISNG